MRLQVKFPVEVKKLMRYLEGKRKETGSDMSVTHVAMRAVGIALREVPEVRSLDSSLKSSSAGAKWEMAM